MRLPARLVRLVALCALVCGARASHAEVYRWVDAEGRLHFTENLEQVPPDQRATAMRRAAEQAPSPVQTYSSSARAASPARGARAGEPIRIPFARDGTLMRVDVMLNDRVSAPFYIDTGASGISLPSQVADQLGIHIGPDTPHIRVTTAAGVVSRPVVLLDAVQLGAARVEGLEATVNPAMHIGLLGGTFFNNFVYQVDAAQSEIVLALNERMRGGIDEQSWRDRFRSLRDPLERLEAYLESETGLRADDRARLERNRDDLLARLRELEAHANRYDVPQAWRR